MQYRTKRWLQRFLWVILVSAVIFFGMRVYFRLTDDFRIANMTYPLPYNAEWEIEKPTGIEKEKLHLILDQPYTYLGKGAQSYAFLSQDKKYVLKFFKFKHLKPNWLVTSLPDISIFHEYKTKNISRKKRLIDSVFQGYVLAYDVHRADSGLEYIHLNKTVDFNEKVTLYDKIGLKHQIDLDDVVFIIQEAVIPLKQVMKQALDQGDLTLAIKRMDQIIDLYLLEYSKGIYDRDHGVMHNTGFAGERPIHLDLGKMSRDPEMIHKEHSQQDLLKVITRMESWLEVNYPQYRKQMMHHLELNLKAIYGEQFALSHSK